MAKAAAAVAKAKAAADAAAGKAAAAKVAADAMAAKAAADAQAIIDAKTAAAIAAAANAANAAKVAADVAAAKLITDAAAAQAAAAQAAAAQAAAAQAAAAAVAAAAAGVKAAAVYAYLGTAGNYTVLADAAVTAPASTITGNVGAGAAITLDAQTTIHGGLVRSNAESATALADLAAGYATLSTLPTTGTLNGTDLGGQTLTPGVYHSNVAIAISDTVTFDAGGDPNAVFVIQTDAALNTTASTSTRLLNGAKASNIYWVSAGAVTLGASSIFDGTIVSDAAVTIGAQSTILGKALSVTAATTLDSDTIDGTNNYTN
ncbi:MAG: DUF3494 domain-containing protein [Kineosporiaceae bacterium]|nr:DUF3494 domain-containing protein [Aeromicrobium sp.]